MAKFIMRALLESLIGDAVARFIDFLVSNHGKFIMSVSEDRERLENAGFSSAQSEVLAAMFEQQRQCLTYRPYKSPNPTIEDKIISWMDKHPLYSVLTLIAFAVAIGVPLGIFIFFP